MGLVQNLKKKLNNWVDRTLAELCSAYIKQLARQTTKRRNSSLLTESLQNSLTLVNQSSIIVTSSQDTSEKTITILDKTDEIVDEIREWSINKIATIEPVGSKMALYEEFEEWIELDDEESIEILSSGKKIVDKPLED